MVYPFLYSAVDGHLNGNPVYSFFNRIVEMEGWLQIDIWVNKSENAWMQ